VRVAPNSVDFTCAGMSSGPSSRGFHSFTSQLNLCAFYGIGGARRGCVARVKVVFGGV
jgi:hypothetical protein